jgi:hypothetical protein
MSYVRILCVLLAWLSGFASYAQPATKGLLERRYDAFSRFRIAKYQPDVRYAHYVLAADFKTDSLRLQHSATEQIVRIDLVYTAFRRSDAFDQQQLNLNRLTRLANALPGVLTDSAISWNLMEQTGCDNADACRDFLHGFVVYTEKRYTKADLAAEADSITRLLHSLDEALALKKSSTRAVPISCHSPQPRYLGRRMARRLKRYLQCPESLRGTIKFAFALNAEGHTEDVKLLNYTGLCADVVRSALQQALAWETGLYLNGKSYAATVTGSLRSTATRRDLRITDYALADTALARKSKLSLKKNGCYAKPSDVIEVQVDDNAVSRVLDRNPAWKQSLIVVDVTGSMYSYTLDMLAWLRLSTSRMRRTFVFFNDGDDADDRAKKIGRTGGLYTIQTAEYAQARDKMLAAMKGGGGGDLPENNGEALLRGFELVPAATEAILIADNHAFPRDSRLLAKLAGRNVKIILCGTTPGINPAYLDLARKYRFSIHTMEADLTQLFELHDGEKVIVDGVEYEVTKDGFRARSTSEL